MWYNFANTMLDGPSVALRFCLGIRRLAWQWPLCAVLLLAQRALAAAMAPDLVGPIGADGETSQHRLRDQLLQHGGCLEYGRTGRCLPNFIVLGVQKAGTSTLFQLMRSHPQIIEPEAKELHFFYTSNLVSLCESPMLRPRPEELLAYACRFPPKAELSNRSLLTGEWSATYLVCWCCPLIFLRVLPRTRLLVQLRDPISRAHARFMEFQSKTEALARSGRPAPYFAAMVRRGFDRFALLELSVLNACLERNSSLRSTVECAADSNVFGWSLYDIFLRHWLAYVRPSDLLVTYVEDLAADPLSVMRSVEAHLSIAPRTYTQWQLSGFYNARGGYGWDTRADGIGLGGIAREHRRCQELGIEFVVCRKLEDLYRPHVLELERLGREGQISPVPESWREMWLVP